MFEQQGRLVQAHVSPRCPSCNHLPEVAVPIGVTAHFTSEPLPADQAEAARRELKAAYDELHRNDEPDSER